MDPSPPPPPLALSTPATATVDDAVAQPAEPPSPSPDTTTASPSSRSTNTTVTWANQIGGATSKATEKVAAGTTKMVGWTYEHAKIETATAARGLRPLHVRVSVRVHHVAFLHPGLDNGSRATISDGASRRWKKNKKATNPPGLLQFGKQKGDWKNPLTPKSKPFSRGDSDLSNTAKLRKKLECEDGMDASEISEIISAEAFRLSRDGIIQHHYALNRTASPQQSSPADNQRLLPPRSPRFSLLKNSNKNNATTATTTQSNIHSSILSPYSCENPQEAARYYKECAERPKGYRRLVVSSVTPISDVKVPPPPAPSSGLGANMNYAATSSSALLGSGGESNRRLPRKLDDRIVRKTSTSTWGFESDSNLNNLEEKGEKKKSDEKNEHMFDNVEYQYIGPPHTGPEFFQLLRAHGAATFGRYLPELACSVPNHSIGFELRKPKSKRRCASTQPLVVEAPHIVWGDARDKMLSRIAKEGCPLIDSRKFEYVTNADLGETEMSESLMVCGATLWVQNAPDGSEKRKLPPLSPRKQHKTKGMLQAEYYGGKMIDGMKEGLGLGVKGLAKGTEVMVDAAEKGTKEVLKGTKEATEVVTKGTKEAVNAVGRGLQPISPISLGRESSSGSTTTHSLNEERRSSKSSTTRTRKRDKLKSMFDPKKVGTTLRRRSRKSKGDDSSIASSVGGDDYSVGSESLAESGRVTNYLEKESITDEDAVKAAVADTTHSLKESTVDKDFDTYVDESEVSPTTKNELEEQFTVLKTVPYELLLDDVIDIRIVSFPEKNDVIANFPISVASVMVQRSIEDRINDPLKPSELTATFVQEPSAPELRWGVELKVTLRAVEVKPHVPTVVPRPVDVIDEEMKKFKQKLKLLGKKPDDMKKDLQAKEEEIAQEENDLNKAIVAYGYGKGENAGAGQEEVRLMQMFYCDREHGVIERKMKRRTMLTDSEKKMISDAVIDPSSVERDSDEQYVQKMLELLEVNFPGIEKEETTTKTRADISKDDFSTLAKTSLAMAQSLDICLGDLTEKPTVPAVQRRLHNTFTEGITQSNVTTMAAKKWCSDVADRLSNASVGHGTIKSSITKIQSIIAESALGAGIDMGEGEIDTNEESKLDEDEIALSQATSFDAESAKLQDWVTAVASQLEAYAEELDDSQESISTFGSVEKLDKVENALPSEESLGGGNAGPASPNLSGRSSVDSGMGNDELSARTSSFESRSKIDPDGELWERVLSRKESGKSLTDSTLRFRSATYVSTVKHSLPSSPRSNKLKKSQADDILEIMKKSHGHSHHISMKPSSLSATMAYLFLTLTIFALGVTAMFKCFHSVWSIVTG